MINHKVLGINGSANANGNTHIAIEIVRDALKQHDIDLEIIDLVNYNINPFSFSKQAMEDDFVEIFKKVKNCDGLILASPVYYSNITSRMMMFIERIGSMSKGSLEGKIGASIAIARRAGTNFAYASMNFFFGIHQMPIATSTYWNMSLAKTPGQIKEDAEGIKTLENLGNNIAKMILKLRL
ncbi:MAG: flavodoxin family protein [Promethearchaeota archaeon]